MLGMHRVIFILHQRLRMFIVVLKRSKDRSNNGSLWRWQSIKKHEKGSRRIYVDKMYMHYKKTEI